MGRERLRSGAINASNGLRGVSCPLQMGRFVNPSPSDPIAWVGQFEKELNLPNGFFLNLLIKEDDWSFTIKLHALVEAAVSHLLASICGDRLLDIFTRLELSSDTIGKVAFAKALDVLDKDERTFVRKLSEIRNSFAHDVRKAGATLANYVAGLNNDQLKVFSRGAACVAMNPFTLAMTASSFRHFASHSPVTDLMAPVSRSERSRSESRLFATDSGCARGPRVSWWWRPVI